MTDMMWGIGLGLVVLAILQCVPPFVSWWRATHYQLPVLSSPLSAFVHLIVPCKGGGESVERHLKAFVYQNYRPLLVTFVTESELDTAVPVISNLVARHDHVRHVVAGLSDSGSQKIHNLLAAVDLTPSKTEIMAFCDADIQPETNLLNYLIHALVGRGVTVATGYRWLAPVPANLTAKLHTILSYYMVTFAAWPTSPFVWGGTWAIRYNDWKRLGVAKHWRKRFSDDLSLQNLLRRDGSRSEFVPWCVSSTTEALGKISELIDWFSRQVFYMRVYTPLWWWVVVTTVLLLFAAMSTAVSLLIVACFGRGVFEVWLPISAMVFILAVLGTPLAMTTSSKYELTFARFNWVTLVPLVAGIVLICVLRSIFIRQVTWANITYTFNKDGTVKQVIHPSQPIDH